MSDDKYTDYEDLLRSFEDDEYVSKKKPAETGDDASSEEQSDKAYRRAQEARKERIRTENEAQESDSENENAYKNGVYFSNPPEDIRARAEEQRQRDVSPLGKYSVITPPPTEDQQELMAAKQQKKDKRTERAEKIKAASKKRLGKLPHFTFTLAIIIFFSVILSVYGIHCVNDIFALHSDNKTVEVKVDKGATNSEVVKLLHKNGLIKDRLFCTLFLKAAGEKGKFVEGVYSLSADMGLEKMISTMQADYKSSETVSITFPEGYTAKQIAVKLEENKVCTSESFLSTIASVDFSNEYPFLKKLDKKNQRFCVLEGYLYPDTYSFYVGETASSVVRRFLSNFQKKWTNKYAARAASLGMSVDDVITMASILQKEAATADQMSGISSVLHNRLAKPSTYPWLQCDSTEKYLLETIKKSLSSSTADTEKYINYRNYYDTYSTACIGLPVGAIGNPGIEAIKAALYPDDTSYYYFRHDTKGNIYYAKTFAEQERNGEKIASEAKK